MGKGKKGGKRMNKAQLTEKLHDFFASQPGVTLSFKEIFRALHLDTHPLKMLAIDIMEEMAWDDYLAKVSDNSYRLNQSIQVMEGKFVRKPNGKNSVIPEGSEKPIFVSERNSMGALSGDMVEFTFLARRKNHIKEAQVNRIIERAKDSFVGRLKVDKDIAYLVTPSDVFAHNIIIPKRKLKGGKTDDKAVVRIIEWPDGENKSPIGEVVDVLGQKGDNDVEMNSILAQYGLPYKYPKNVEDAANKITGEITEQDYKEREDFRDVFTCTIDPKDAKDFDDALSIQKLDNLLSPLLKKGQSIAHIYASHADEIACSRRTIYSYIDRGVFQARNIDLRRKVVYKQRKRKTTTSLKDRSFRKDRGYKEFLEYIAANKSVYVVEMDTVEGAKGTSPCFLTMFFRNCSLMLMFLLEEQTQKEVTRIFDHLTELLGIELFQKLFEVILTDNGHEFQDRQSLEYSKNDEVRTRIYYCDPNRSDQKGALEKNHEYIRYVLPKGTSFEKMTDKTTLLLLNHINSEKRDSLNGHSPYEVSRLLLDNRLHKALGLAEIPADEVTLIPALIK